MNQNQQSSPLCTTVKDVRAWVREARRLGKTVGLVPTMGALHDGHASLIAASARHCDVTIVSIFVNPLQFGPGEDLARYPRTLDADRRLCAAAGASLVYSPLASEMYPEGFVTRVEMAVLPEPLCGRSRPGHFSGVETVVLKLLLQVMPDRAFFGRKDYQQAKVVQRMVRDLDVDVQIEVCPIVRESDGLAMSSRNRYLDADARRAALSLRRAILEVQRAFREGERNVPALEDLGRKTLSRSETVRCDYFEIRGPEVLEQRSEAKTGDLIAVAAFVGGARLIDNGLLGEE